MIISAPCFSSLEDIVRNSRPRLTSPVSTRVSKREFGIIQEHPALNGPGTGPNRHPPRAPRPACPLRGHYPNHFSIKHREDQRVFTTKFNLFNVALLRYCLHRGQERN